MSEKRKPRMETFHLPEGYDCKSFVMRELTNEDRYTVSAWLERKIAALPTEDETELRSAEQLRLSLVAVDGVPVNLDSVPYTGIDTWSRRTCEFAIQAWVKLNAVDQAAVKKCLEEAVPFSEEDLRRLLLLATPAT